MSSAPQRRTWAILGRLLRPLVWLSAAAFWLALLIGYLLDASPLDVFEVSVKWARPAGSPAPSHRAQGELRIGH